LKYPLNSRRSTSLAILLVFFSCTVANKSVLASPDFSNAHKKIERSLERAQNSSVDAMWVQHNVLLIAVNKNRGKHKAYAKSVCQFLAQHGFAAQQTKVIITDKEILRSRNQWSQLAERDCQ
jgi:hypothetical protein